MPRSSFRCACWVWTTYKVSYNDRDFAPASVEASTGYAAADKHFPKSWLNNDIVYVKSDHDMRNTTDMISLDRIAKAIIRTPGVALVQSVTRPNGRPLEHASLPYALGSTGTKIGENIGFLRDRVADIDTLAAKTGNHPRRNRATGRHHQTTRERHPHIARIRGTIAGHLQRNPRSPGRLRRLLPAHARTTSIGSRTATTSRSAGRFDRCYDSLDGVDALTDELGNTVRGITIIDTVTPQVIPQIETVVSNLRATQTLTLTLQSTLHSLVSQLDPFINPLIDLAQAFDNAKNDDFFFLPPDALKTDDFKVGMNFFMTPDGKGARFVFYHTGEAQSPEGIKQVEDVTAAAQEAIKGTSLSNAKISLAGAASNYRDVRDYSANDIIIMMLATFALVFIIVLAITRALVGAVIVLITVMLSFAGAFGLSVFVWETLLHTQLHWLTLPIAFIVLVAVGCDYNLLLLSRYRAGDRRRRQDRADPDDGQFRRRGLHSGLRLRLHHVGPAVQRRHQHRPSRLDHLHGIDVRHDRRATVPGDAAGPGARSVVLVAAEDSESPQARARERVCRVAGPARRH